MKRIVVIGSRRQGKTEQIREMTKAAIDEGQQVIMASPPLSNGQILVESIGRDIIKEIQDCFADAAQSMADAEEQQERAWLTFWAGPQWGDEAPNRLFGAWLNQDGEAV